MTGWLKHIAAESIEWVSVVVASVFGNTLVKSAEAKRRPVHEATIAVGQKVREMTQFDRKALDSGLAYLNDQLSNAKPPRSSAIEKLLNEMTTHKGVLKINSRRYLENDLSRWLNELVQARGNHVLIRLDAICRKSREEFVDQYELQNNDGVRQHLQLAKNVTTDTIKEAANWIDEKADEAVPYIAEGADFLEGLASRLENRKGGKR